MKISLGKFLRDIRSEKKFSAGDVESDPRFITLLRTQKLPLVAAMHIALLASFALSQTPAGWSLEIAKKGWSVPMVKSLQVEETTELDVKGQKVTQYLYRLVDPKPVVHLTKYVSCEFNSLVGLAINGKVFAIGGTCYHYGNSQYGKISLAAVTTFTYYDEDGDGKFETKYQTPLIKVYVPERLRDRSIPAPNSEDEKPPPLIIKPALGNGRPAKTLNLNLH